MSSKSQELREALIAAGNDACEVEDVGYYEPHYTAHLANPTIIAAAIVSTLGITREMVEVANRCAAAADWLTARGLAKDPDDANLRRVHTIRDSLTAILDVAEGKP